MHIRRNYPQRPNPTHVARHFINSKPVSVKKILPPMPTLVNGNPMARLSMGVMTAKESHSIQELHGLLTQGPLDSRYLFPDTSFLQAPIPDNFWDFGNNRTIVFPEIITKELSGWMARPIANQGIHAWLTNGIARSLSSNDFDGPMRMSTILGNVKNRYNRYMIGVLDRNSMDQFGYQYYVNLLTLRKKIGVQVATKLAAQYGRLPTDEEVRNQLHREYHHRTCAIAFKGWKDNGKPNYSADEELVSSAFINAIMTGQTTTILTRDNDIFDQFVKMAEMITRDYMCLRFGEALNHAENNIEMGRLEITADDSVETGFVGNYIDTIVLSESDAENLPPASHSPVHCFCALVGNTAADPRISLAGYCLEREMWLLLNTKAVTHGKNTRHFGNNNIIIGSGSFSLGRGIMFALGEEKRINFEGIDTTWLDLKQVTKDDPDITLKEW